MDRTIRSSRRFDVRTNENPGEVNGMKVIDDMTCGGTIIGCLVVLFEEEADD